MKKAGFIFECGPDGADLKVVRHLTKRIQPELEFVHRTLDNKPKLIEDCGRAARQLIAAGCEKVFIIWDLIPTWKLDNEKPCRHEDRMRIYAQLALEQVLPEQVVLLCI